MPYSKTEAAKIYRSNMIGEREGITELQAIRIAQMQWAMNRRTREGQPAPY